LARWNHKVAESADWTHKFAVSWRPNLGAAANLCFISGQLMV